jgi:hypothetical protein
VWGTSWDSDDDAEDFVEKLIQRESDRLGEDADEDNGTYTIATSDAVVKVHIDGTEVTYTQAPDEESAQALLDAQLAK